MPIDYSRYPPNWKTEIRPRILARAGQVINENGRVIKQARCDKCRVVNKAMIWRWPDGTFDYCEDWQKVKRRGVGFYLKGEGRTMIVLTIAHLDHDECNHDVKNNRLAALCQRCHIVYDAKEKAKRRRVKKYSKSLFPID